MLNIKDITAKVINLGGETLGTCFSLDGEFWATCAHVVSSDSILLSQEVKIVLQQNGFEIPANVVKKDPDLDVALLRLTQPIKGLSDTLFGTTNEIDGHFFKSFGYAEMGNWQGVHADGKILGIIENSKSTKALQLSSPDIRRGMSGAPVFDSITNCVVGMITSYYQPSFRDSHYINTAFALPIESLKTIFPDLNLQSVSQNARRSFLLSIIKEFGKLKGFSNELDDFEQAFVPLTLSDGSKLLELNYLLEILENQNVLIIGQPGSGKTTLLKWIALQLASANIQSNTDLTRLPFYVPLKQIKYHISTDANQIEFVAALDKLINDKITRTLSDDNPDNHKNILLNSETLFLLDGFDELELKSYSALDRFMKAIETISSRNNSHFILTSRTLWATEAHLEKYFDVSLEIPDLTEQQIELFIKKSGNDDFQISKLSPSLQELTRTPLYLFFIISLYKQKQLSKEMVTSAHLIGQVMQERLRIEDIPSSLRETDRRHEWQILYNLAKILKSTGSEEINHDKNNKHNIIEALAAGLPSRVHEAEEFINKWFQKQIILIDDDDNIQFWHEGFQTYILARLIAKAIKDVYEDNNIAPGHKKRKLTEMLPARNSYEEFAMAIGLLPVPIAAQVMNDIVQGVDGKGERNYLLIILCLNNLHSDKTLRAKFLSMVSQVYNSTRVDFYFRFAIPSIVILALFSLALFHLDLLDPLVSNSIILLTQRMYKLFPFWAVWSIGWFMIFTFFTLIEILRFQYHKRVIGSAISPLVEAISNANFSEAAKTLRNMWKDAAHFYVIPGVNQTITRAYLKTLPAEERWQTEALNPGYQGANLLFIEDAINSLPPKDSPSYEFYLKLITPEKSVEYLLSLLSSDHEYIRFSNALKLLSKFYSRDILADKIINGIKNIYTNKYSELSWIERKEIYSSTLNQNSSLLSKKPSLLISDLSRRTDTGSKAIEFIKEVTYWTLIILAIIFGLLFIYTLFSIWNELMFFMKYWKII